MTNFLKVFSKLESLKEVLENEEKNIFSDAKFALELNEIINLVDVDFIGSSELEDFRIPDAEMKPKLLGITRGVKRYHPDKKLVNRNFLFMKTKGVYNFLIASPPKEEKIKMGFGID